MTIAALWKEDNLLWCAADTRLVAGKSDDPTTESASKIFTVPLSTSAFDAEGSPRQPHYWTQYGFVYSGSALSAIMTVGNCTTLFQRLVSPGFELENPPHFHDVAACVKRISEHFMRERRSFGSDGLFDAVFFGWCPYAEDFKVALIEGRDDSGSFRVDLSYPEEPAVSGEPWVVIGSGKSSFEKALSTLKVGAAGFVKRVPKAAIEDMIAKSTDKTVGGAISLGAAHKRGFEVFSTIVPIVPGEPEAYQLFNGMDLARNVGSVGRYSANLTGLA